MSVLALLRAGRHARLRVRGAGAALALASTLASAQPVAEPTHDPRAPDLREEVALIEITLRDLNGRVETRPFTVTRFRPPGDGPFPLVVLNHGRATADRRTGQSRRRFEELARHFVGLGFAVLVPTRVGYGEGEAGFDPEEPGPCNLARYEPMAQAAADQVIAAVESAAALPWADTRRWIAVGSSVGGLASLAAAARRPPGLLAAINFSGGAGGDPVRRRAAPCSPAAIETLWRALGATAAVDTLWIYWSHDRYWGDRLPLRWAQAWAESGGRVEWHQLGPWSDEEADGHTGITRDIRRWAPLVEAFLARAGFARDGGATRSRAIADRPTPRPRVTNAPRPVRPGAPAP